MGIQMKGTEHSFHTWDVIIDNYDSPWGESFKFALYKMWKLIMAKYIDIFLGGRFMQICPDVNCCQKSSKSNVIKTFFMLILTHQQKKDKRFCQIVVL